MSSPAVDLDVPGVGVRLRATRRPGTGPAVLLLHGLASTRRFWGPVSTRLDGLPLVALDQRGHGESERPTGPYDGATVVADALSVLDALDLDQVVVVGHSWGAGTALRLAATAPERVLAVVAVDGGLTWGPELRTPEERARRREQMTPPRTAVPPDQLAQMVRGGALGPWWSPEVEAAVLAIFATGDDGLARPRLPFEAHMAIVDALLDDTEVLDRLARISCPAWAVVCTGVDPSWDGFRTAALERAAQLLPRPRLQTWQGALHDVPLQWPGLVAGLVRAAVEEVA